MKPIEVGAKPITIGDYVYYHDDETCYGFVFDVGDFCYIITDNNSYCMNSGWEFCELSSWRHKEWEGK